MATNMAERHGLSYLLDKDADQGVGAIEDTTVLQLAPFARMGTTVELIKSLGGKQQYKAAIQELEQVLYKDQDA